jgi:hypothetical protein
LFLLHHSQVHASTQRPIAPAKLLVNYSFSWSHLLIEYFSSDSSHVSGAWSRQEALGVVVATSVLDGEGVASESLH